MRIVISGLNRKGQEIFYKGYGDELTGKGLGSGALTGTNRVPIFTEDITKAKKIETFIDAKRIMLLKDAIGRLEEIDYYLCDYETEENEFARVIQISTIMLKEILPKVEKYELED